MNEQLKSYKTVDQIARKHRMDVSDIRKQLDMGASIEHEHTNNQKLAVEIALQHLDEIPDYYTRLKKMEANAKKEHKKFKDVTEGNLRRWFQGSKSKNKELGWVDVVDGDACAREEGETATPKCVSSEKRASMSKEERLAAQAAKRREDPNQPQKSGASKPTMVTTDRKTRKEEMDLQEIKDKPGKGSGKKDACYSKVKSRYDVWPSAYASGALVKCRKVGAANWGIKSEAVNAAQQAAIAINMKNEGKKPKEIKESCWSGYKKEGMKKKGKKIVPNCVPVNSESTGSLGYDWDTPLRERADRYCPKCEKLERRSECKYGTKYWDMFSVPAEVIGSKKDYNITMPHPGNMPEEKDHEYSMARSEISTIIGAAKRLRKKIGKGEGNIVAWVQSKITKAADYLDTAADYVDSGEMKKESVSIEDSNGNHYAEFIDIIKSQPLKPSKGIGSRLVGEGALPSPIDPSAHKQAQRTQKLYNKGTGTDNTNEKEIFLKRTGPQLPLAKKEDKKELQTAHYNMKTFGDFMSEAKKSEMKCNSPKSEPVGDSLTGKSHVVKACEGGKEKLLRFGQRGVKGSPKKEGESKAHASRRHRFQNRHAKNISKGKMSAAYWANKVKW